MSKVAGFQTRILQF